MKFYKLTGKKNIVGERVFLKREELGLSQERFAAQLQVESFDITQNAVSRLELGKRFVADFELLKLSKVLDVSVQWLLTGKEENK